MTPIQKIWTELKFSSDCNNLTEEQIKVLLPLLKEEALTREIKRIESLLKRSGIKRIKRLEDFDWKFNPQIPRSEVMSYNSSSWNNPPKNLVLIGPSGIGKTHLATGLCYNAIQSGIPTAFITCSDLIEKLKRSTSKYAMLQYYSTVKLLCIDELGYVFPTQEQANDLFQIISKRSELVSTIITTNLVPANWGKIFEAATATAILDRLSLNGKFICVTDGDTYRRRKH
jgi:DNA replication protein DnaC